MCTCARAVENSFAAFLHLSDRLLVPPQLNCPQLGQELLEPLQVTIVYLSNLIIAAAVYQAENPLPLAVWHFLLRLVNS